MAEPNRFTDDGSGWGLEDEPPEHEPADMLEALLESEGGRATSDDDEEPDEAEPDQ